MKRNTIVLFATAAALSAAAPSAMAAEPGQEPAVLAATIGTTILEGPLAPARIFRKKCGACHIAYPARFLPRQSWRAIMAGLSDHFGNAVSLDDDATRRIETYLARRAPDWKMSKDTRPPLRVSELGWFKYTHARGVSPRQFSKAGSWANCLICHKDAEKGSYGS